jgi:pilus assembly protein CpaF
VVERLRQKHPEVLKENLKQSRDREVIRSAVRSEVLQEQLAYRERAELEVAVFHDLVGYGPVQPLIEDPEVTEIRASRFDAVYAERGGVFTLTPVRWRSEEHIRTTAERIAMGVGRRIDESCPVVDARLDDGSRVNIVIPPVAVRGTTISIRKFPETLTLGDLTKLGALSGEAAEYLRSSVHAGKNIIVAGEMGSGKTTLLNALTGLIPPSRSIVTIEDVAELRVQHPDVRALEAQMPNIEGKGGISLAYLTRTALLRMKPNWIILGECRGPEAYYVLQAMSVGHSACTTFHANSAEDALLTRFPGMIMQSEEGRALTRHGVLAAIAAAVHLVVYTRQLADGARRVTEIAAVHKDPEKIIRVQKRFGFDGEKLVEEGEFC